MGTVKTLYVFICLVLFGLSIAVHGQVSRQCLSERIKAYDGVREATNRNDGPEVEHFQRMAGAPAHSAWCAAYVYTCHKECDSTFALKSPAWSPSWFAKDKVIWKQGKGRQPEQCDVFGLYYREKKRVAHVGFIWNWDGDPHYAITDEGNTNSAGSREGNGKYRKRRMKEQIYVISRHWTAP